MPQKNSAKDSTFHVGFLLIIRKQDHKRTQQTSYSLRTEKQSLKREINIKNKLKSKSPCDIPPDTQQYFLVT